MKKATWVVTIVLLIEGIGLFNPKQAKAIDIINGYFGPFSLTELQIAQVHIVNMPPDSDNMCQAEVRFIGPDGMVIRDAGCMTLLRGNEIKTCDFEGNGMRKQYVAQIIVSGQNARDCKILSSFEVYDTSTGQTTAVAPTPQSLIEEADLFK